MMDFFENMFWTLMFLLLLCLVISTPIKMGMQTHVERQCLAMGYRDGDWRLIGPDYCIQRVDQTDVVVPLTTARANNR
jgi:hypothetical protein